MMNDEPANEDNNARKTAEYRPSWKNRATVLTGGALAGYGLYKSIDWLTSLSDDPSSFSHDDIVTSVHGASDFFGLPDPMKIIEHADTPAAAVPGHAESAFDDLIMVNSSMLNDLQVTGSNELDMVMTHEAAHRFFQQGTFHDLPLASHNEELACDFMAGLRAGQEGWNVNTMQNVFSTWEIGPEHPAGNLRADILGFASNLALEHPDLSPTEAMPYLEDYLANHQVDVFSQIDMTQNGLGEDLGIDLNAELGGF